MSDENKIENEESLATGDAQKITLNDPREENKVKVREISGKMKSEDTKLERKAETTILSPEEAQRLLFIKIQIFILDTLITKDEAHYQEVFEKLNDKRKWREYKALIYLAGESDQFKNYIDQAWGQLLWKITT